MVTVSKLDRAAERVRSPFTLDELARARYDRRGIFIAGRRAELDALRAMGARDPSLGRLYEGHFNGALLVALHGSDAQARRAHADVAAGRLFGVWNTQEPSEPLTIVTALDGTLRLRGAKTWASGADFVERALVTARRRDGAIQLCVVPMERDGITIDASAWRPLGMEASNSYRVRFDDVELTADDCIGDPGCYEQEPWFSGGALRFAAVHAGIVERIVREALAFLVERKRDEEPAQVARAGEMRMAERAARLWVAAGEDAWRAFDLDPTERRAGDVRATVDMARLAIERLALDALELAVRSVGASGLVEPSPLATLVRDLTMYLRQPAPDAVLARVGNGAFAEARSARSAAIATSTGSSA